MTNEKKGRLVIIILTGIVLTVTGMFFINKPDTSEQFIGNSITTKNNITYQITEEESGIRVDKYSGIFGFKSVMKCEALVTEMEAADGGFVTKLKNCGVGKKKKDVVISREW